MPGFDWIPGVSQLKSTLQLVTGDFEGAARTQENFFKECPGVSQVTSTVQAIAGDPEGAWETQKRCLSTVNNVANGIPVIGHVKGFVHHAVGDREGGDRALNAATRSAVVIGSGAAAAVATGGLGAIPAGIAAGAGYDIAATVITDKPQGYVAAFENVIENPSAGSIFDAAAIPVGDGFAGYSGGQITKQVTSQVKFNNLKDVLFDETGGGVGADAGRAGGMTSGQLDSLGERVKTLKAEINTIGLDIPKCWYDPKTNENEDNENENAPPVCRREFITEMEDDTIYAQSYVEAKVTDANRKHKEKILDERFNANPGEKTLKERYPNVAVLTGNDPKTKMKNENNGEWLSNPNEEFLLHVEMPSQFNYTGAILLNNTRQGLLHTFIRHGDEWQDYIDGVDELLGEWSDIKEKLEKVRRAKNPNSYKNLISKFDNALSKLDVDTYIEASINVQTAIYKFLQKNVTYEQYLGEGVNERDFQQVYFKVKDKQGNIRVMVVCISNELYPPDDRFPDGRPIKTITTVFFITWEKFKENLVRKQF